MGGEGKIADWGAAEYTRGAYSFGTVDSLYMSPSWSGETVFDFNARATLQGPVADGRVFFAGEATSLQMSATVPGAVEDGERAADEVCQVVECTIFPTHAPTTSSPTTYFPSTEWKATAFPTTYPPTTSPNNVPAP